MKKIIYTLGTALLFFWLFTSSNAVMAQQPFITLIQPTGPNVVWSGGETHVITWNDNIVTPVNVLVSLDGGATFTTIATNVTGTTYYWNTTGYTAGNQYRIKIESQSGTYSDMSSHNFSIEYPANGFITINQPTGGENWAEGQTYLISWDDNLSDQIYVAIYHGSSMVASIGSTYGSTISWTIPYGLTTGYSQNGWKIKLWSANPQSTTPPVYSSSFSISKSNGTFIEVYQPAGGEKWAQGTTHLISWNDDITDPNTPVVVSLYNGNTFSGTLGTTLGTTLLWTVPSSFPAGNNYRIRVESAIDPTLYDRSNRFSLTKSEGSFIEVYQPNGGERWAQGTTHLISWNDDLPEPVDIVLYRGSDVDTLAQDVVGSTFYWTISDTVPAHNGYRIKVISSKDPSLYDRSNHGFRITKSAGSFIEVIQPNGSESWAKNTTHLISWNDDLPEPVDIVLYRGSDIDTLAQDVVGSTFYWTISDTVPAHSSYRIKVISSKDPSLYDRSDAGFSITNSAGTYVEVLQPNGGETWARGTSHLISWIDDMPEAANIELLKGSSVYATLATNVVGSTWVWDISDTTLVGTNYKIRVSSTIDPNLNDRSNTYFKISASAGTYIEVQQPNGGEQWVAGSSYWISWIDDVPEPVNVVLLKGNSVHDTIALDVVGSTYIWDIPSTQVAGTNYKVKVYSTLDPNLYDKSNANFTIFAAPMMTAYPNPANNFVTLEMKSNNTENYTVEMYDRFNNKVMNTIVNPGGTNQVKISTQSLPTGIYFMVVTSPSERTTKKIIVQH
jgi:hypothetical protein